MLARLCAPLPCAPGMPRRLHPDLRTFDSGVEIIQPRNLWIHVLRQQLFWEILIVVSKLLDVGGIIVSYDDSIVGDPKVPIEPLEEGLSQVTGVPTYNRLSEMRAQLVNDSLSNQRHGHLRVANMQVLGAGALPA